MSARVILFLVVLGLLASGPAMVRAAAVDSFENVDSGGLIKVPAFFKGTPGAAGSRTLGGLILIILNILMLAIGSISVIYFMIGGFRYVTAHGNEEQAEAAKKTMIHAILGFIVVLMSFAIISIITNIITQNKLQ